YGGRHRAHGDAADGLQDGARRRPVPDEPTGGRPVDGRAERGEREAAAGVEHPGDAGGEEGVTPGRLAEILMIAGPNGAGKTSSANDHNRRRLRSCRGD